MPEVCNAMETLLVSRALSAELSRIVETLRKYGVTVRGCEETRAIVDGVEPATEADWREAIARMGRKRPGWIHDSELPLITQYVLASFLQEQKK